MKAAEKVEKIKNIASVLTSSSWSEIDLIFRQFGIPTSSNWSGDIYDYILIHLEDAKSANLSELYEYLVGNKNSETKYNNVWKKGVFNLFLSHITKDKMLVSDVKLNLKKYAIESFVAHEDIEPTKEWMGEIESALETCDALVAFLTPNFHKSSWTDQEIGFCIKRRVLIIPIKLELDPYGFISKYQALQGKKKEPSELADEIFDILLSHDLTSSKMAESIVRQFENSDSFLEAKSNIELLEKIKRWTPQLLNKIEVATKDNSQIKYSFGVQARVNQLIKKYGK